MLASLIVPNNFPSTSHNSKPVSSIPSYIPNEEYYDVKYDCHSPHLYSFPIFHNDHKMYCEYPDFQPDIFIAPPAATDVDTSTFSRIASFESNVLSNQNEKYEDFLELGQKNELVINAQDDSCNAVDHNLGVIKTMAHSGTSLSFNGKINNILMENAEATIEKVRFSILSFNIFNKLDIYFRKHKIFWMKSNPNKTKVLRF